MHPGTATPLPQGTRLHVCHLRASLPLGSPHLPQPATTVQRVNPAGCEQRPMEKNQRKTSGHWKGCAGPGAPKKDQQVCTPQTRGSAHRSGLTRRGLRLRREAHRPAQGRLAGRCPSSWGGGGVRLFVLFSLTLTGWGAGVLRRPTIHMYTHAHNAHSHMHTHTRPVRRAGQES